MTTLLSSFHNGYVYVHIHCDFWKTIYFNRLNYQVTQGSKIGLKKKFNVTKHFTEQIVFKWLLFSNKEQPIGSILYGNIFCVLQC